MLVLIGGHGEVVSIGGRSEQVPTCLPFPLHVHLYWQFRQSLVFMGRELPAVAIPHLKVVQWVGMGGGGGKTNGVEWDVLYESPAIEKDAQAP